MKKDCSKKSIKILEKYEEEEDEENKWKRYDTHAHELHLIKKTERRTHASY